MSNLRKAIFLLLTFTFCLLNSFSQTAPAIQWQNTFGGNSTDWLNSINQAADGGFICGGYSTSILSCDKTENIIGFGDFWVVKLDSSGSIQWQNTIGGMDIDYLQSMFNTNDGGYICGGSSSSNISGDKTENSLGANDYWVVKLDSSGNIQWQNTIGGSLSEAIWSIAQTADGGYICGGNSNSDISGDKTENSMGGSDYWVVKLNSAGAIQWQNTIGGDSTDYLNSISQTADGGYICGGSSLSNISGDKTENCIGGTDYWVVKLDSSGTIQWQNTIGGNSYESVFSVFQTPDGGYIIGGSSNSNISGDKTENSQGLEDYWIVKLSSSGIIQWQNTIGGNSGETLRDTRQTSDGGYIMGGLSDSNISGDKTENCLGGSDFWVIKLNASGNIQWQNTIGGNGYDGLYSVTETNDGGYMLGGDSQSIISGDKTENSCNNSTDFWVVRLYPDTITGISDFEFRISDFNISPNPLTSYSTLTFSNPLKNKFTFSLHDVTGRVVETVNTDGDKIVLEKGNKQAGVYLFNITNEKTGERMNGKIIISD
ncbi:MAG: T9SS type A sorting domain-containing protein [Bacteroidia bacterium]